LQATFKDFYDTLLENLETYNGEYESFIDHGPTLFKVLCDVLNSDIDRSLKLPVCGAIAYYVNPIDVIPEATYGPYGYIDDIYLSSHVLRMVGEGTDTISSMRSQTFQALKISSANARKSHLKS
jgi:uncharacterized membrane protein YkvA (DUF1232 family)